MNSIWLVEPSSLKRIGTATAYRAGAGSVALPGQRRHIGPEVDDFRLQQLEILPSQFDPEDRTTPIETRRHTNKIKGFLDCFKRCLHSNIPYKLEQYLSRFL